MITLTPKMEPNILDKQLQLTIAAGTESKYPGERKNQDFVYAFADVTEHGLPYGLLIVADGVGGQKGGSKASQITVETISTYVEAHWAKVPADPNQLEPFFHQLLDRAILQAHENILIQARHHENRMASTVTCAIIYGRITFVANVGDSRTYFYHHHLLEQITEDHSLVRWLVEQGHITPEEAPTHPYSNVLMQALGAHETPEVSIYTRELLAENGLLLCSDGVWGTLSNAEMLALLENADSLETAVSEIMTHAQDHSDDLTLILAQLKSSS